MAQLWLTDVVRGGGCAWGEAQPPTSKAPAKTAAMDGRNGRFFMMLLIAVPVGEAEGTVTEGVTGGAVGAGVEFCSPHISDPGLARHSKTARSAGLSRRKVPIFETIYRGTEFR
jgi:hypothetical protein